MQLTMFRERFPETFQGQKAKVQVFKTGKWVHPEYGPFEVTGRDLRTMVANFEGTGRSCVVDYDHGTDLGKTPEERRAAGWIRNLSVEGDGLFAEVELTDEGANFVRSGAYRLFSPTWLPNFVNKETGKPQGITLLRGALTNNPFLDGMHPAVALSESAAALLATQRAELSGSSSSRAGDASASLPQPDEYDLRDVHRTYNERHAELVDELVATGATHHDAWMGVRRLFPDLLAHCEAEAEPGTPEHGRWSEIQARRAGSDPAVERENRLSEARVQLMAEGFSAQRAADVADAIETVRDETTTIRFHDLTVREGGAEVGSKVLRARILAAWKAGHTLARGTSVSYAGARIRPDRVLWRGKGDDFAKHCEAVGIALGD